MSFFRPKHASMLLSALALLAFTAPSLQAQTDLPTIDVTAEAGSSGSLTVPSNEEATYIVQQTPGGVAVVDSESFEDTYVIGLKETLGFVPGVYAQTRYAEEVRLSIRGSGLSRGFHLRGITLLQDGIPYNLADGGGDFQQADPLSWQRLEVHRGGNALQYGGTTLGGAINMISKTGRSQPGTRLQLEYGSYDSIRASAQHGIVAGDTDAFISVTAADSAGYRSHEERSSLKINSNVGIKLSDTIETRFYVSGNIIEQKLAGTTTRDAALNNPTAAGAGAQANDIARDIRSIRLANKTTFDLDKGRTLDVGAFVALKDLYHPLNFGVIDQDNQDYGAFAQMSGFYNLGAYRNSYRVGLITHVGHTDAKIFPNNRGSRAGNPFSDADQNSLNFTAYGENRFYVTPEWSFITGGQLTWSEREESNTLNPTESDSRIYRSFNPKVGVMYEPDETLQIFANVSRSHEVPTFAELTQAGLVGFIPLSPQEAITYEIGTRGTWGPYAWDVTLYRSEIEGELLQFTTGVGVPASTFNADETVHQGLELGFDMRLGESLLSDGDHLQFRNVYTYSDFHFVDDAQYGDNDIAGQPPHFYRGELRYDHPETSLLENWHVAANVEWVPTGAEVDFANSLDTPGYAIFGLSGGAQINDRVSVFVDARNLTDEDYIATFSTITDASTAGTSVFYPGEGRSVFTGVRIEF